MSGPFEFVIERFMSNQLDLFDLDQSPIGSLTLDDCGRSDRDMRHLRRRVAEAAHSSVFCSATIRFSVLEHPRCKFGFGTGPRRVAKFQAFEGRPNSFWPT